MARFLGLLPALVLAQAGLWICSLVRVASGRFRIPIDLTGGQ